MTAGIPWDDGTRGKEALLGDMEAILEPDIPDPGRRRFVAILLNAHIRHAIGRSVDDCLGPWIDGEGDGPSPEEAVEAMRTAVKRVRGDDPDDPYRRSIVKTWDL
jgi:hypothetical protein